MVFVLAFSLLCAPAMAYQIKTALTGDEESDGDIFYSQDEPVSSDYYESYTSEDYSDYYSSEDIFNSESYVYSSSDYYSSEDNSDYDSSLPEDSSVIDLSSAEPEPSYNDDSDDYIEYYSYDDGVSYGDAYTSLYSVVEEDRRNTISGGNWSDISIDFEEDSATGSFVIKNTGKGDFSFIKDNNSNSDASLYYWLAGGIACIVVGLCGISFVIVLAADRRKNMAKSAAAIRSASLNKGDTAEVELPDDFDDDYN